MNRWAATEFGTTASPSAQELSTVNYIRRARLTLAKHGILAMSKAILQGDGRFQTAFVTSHTAGCSLMPVRLGPALRRQVNRETADPVSTFVMFARYRRESGVTMRIRRGLQCRPARIVIRQR